MILGLGVDLVKESRFDPELASTPFLSRVFTQAELAACAGDANAAAHLAGKFAAKEAFAKALGTGMRDGLWFTQVEVLNEESGSPRLRPHGQAGDWLDERGVERIHLSITHTAGMAVAVVILEGGGTNQG